MRQGSLRVVELKLRFKSLLSDLEDSTSLRTKNERNASHTYIHKTETKMNEHNKMM